LLAEMENLAPVTAREGASRPLAVRGGGRRASEQIRSIPTEAGRNTTIFARCDAAKRLDREIQGFALIPYARKASDSMPRGARIPYTPAA